MSYKPRDRGIKGDSDRESDHSSHDDTHEQRTQASRLFVGNLSDRVSRADIEERFSKYGRVINVNMQRGFAFVQFAREDMAVDAIKGEIGTTLKGNRIEVSHALESKKRSAGVGRGGRRGSPSPGDRGFRDRRDYSYDKEKDGRDRSLIRGEDRFRDGYRRDDSKNPSTREKAKPDLSSIGRIGLSILFSRRDTPKDDARGFDTGRDYPRRRYEDNYGPARTPGGRAKSEFALDPANAYYKNIVLDPKRPNDCEIIVADKMLRVYAEHVERQFENIGMLVDMAFAKDEAFVSQIIEDVTRRGTMYGVVISSQHEAHRSVTLNILQGSPQEHRNMPLDDAVKLVARKFNEFIQIRREKMFRERAEAGPYGGFLPPDREMQFLLTQLADGKFLTVAELDRVIGYLRDRKEQLEGVSAAQPQQPPTAPPTAAKPAPIQNNEQSLAQKQQELQQKILSIINQNPNNASVPVANEVASLNTAGQMPLAQVVPNIQQPQSKQNPGYINFDNPNVQKALDNLMQTGPKLLESIGVTPAGGGQEIGSAKLMQPPEQQRQLVNQPPGLGDMIIPGLGNPSGMGLQNVNDMNRNLGHQNMRAGNNFGFQGRPTGGPDMNMNMSMGTNLGPKAMSMNSERNFNLGGSMSQMGGMGSAHRGMDQGSLGMGGHNMGSQMSRLGAPSGNYQGPSQMRQNPGYRHPLMGTQLGNPSMQGRGSRF